MVREEDTRKIGSLLVVLLAFGCTQTELESVVAPSFANKVRFQSIFVFVDGVPLAERAGAEKTFVEAFKRHNIRALRSVDYYLLSRKSDPNSLARVLSVSKCEGAPLAQRLLVDRAQARQDRQPTT